MSAIRNLSAEAGYEYIDDTVARSGKDYHWILPLTDTVIGAISLANHNGTGNTLVAKTLPAGIAVPLRFTAITLTSGRCVCFNAVY